MQNSSRFRLSLRLVPYVTLAAVTYLSAVPLPGMVMQHQTHWRAVRKVQPVAAPAPERLCRAGELPKIPRQDKLRYYRELLALHGAPSSKLSVVALRGLAPNGERHPSNDNVGPYNDTLVLIKGDEVIEMRGSTHAGQESSTLSPGGVAQVRPGTFRAYPAGEHDGMPCWEMQTLDDNYNLPCWRDQDADGKISPTEKAVAERNAETADGILLHNGRFDDHGSSIGCQTLPPPTMSHFLDQVGVANGFVYTLVDANQPNPAPQ